MYILLSTFTYLDVEYYTVVNPEGMYRYVTFDLTVPEAHPDTLEHQIFHNRREDVLNETVLEEFKTLQEVKAYLMMLETLEV